MSSIHLGWPSWLILCASLVPGGLWLPTEATGQSLTNQPAQVLTNAGQVKRLKREEALRGYPVKIRGVITCIQPRFFGIVIQDSTLGIYVKYYAAADFNPPQAGDYCEIEGVTDAGFAPMIRPRRVVSLGVGTMPDPVHPTWDQLLNGSLDTQYVELQGILTAVQTDGLLLFTRGGKIRVELPDLQPETLKPCENALVSIRGCLFAMHEDEQVALQVKIGEVQMHNAAISVDEPAPADLFATPTKRAAELLFFDLQAGTFQRVKVSGQIVHQQAQEYYLIDGTNGLRFSAKEPLDLQVSDLVEVVGFPELGGPSPMLREAVARKLGRAPLPAPKQLAPEDLLHNVHDSTLVRVQALLVSHRNNATEQVLELQAGVRTFVARLKGRGRLLKSIPPGSRLELAGVYAGQGGNRALGRDIDSFELLLNSPADVRVLARPPWWTFERMLALVGALAGVLVLALVWITLLRRQVEQRTAELKQEIQDRERAEHHHALEEERSRIARDLHDDLGSSLTEISMLAETGRDQPPSEDSRQKFARILLRAHALVRTLDEIVWAVDPRKDTLPALVRYLSGFAEEYLAAAGLACRVELPPTIPESPLAAHVRHHLFLGVKEALNNVIRHAHAGEVVFRINPAADQLNITITDNGRGFDPAAPSEGNGLANLRQRLAGLGGRCQINSQTGAGTTVLLTLSLTIPGPP